MQTPISDSLEAMRSKTVLDHVRPTVVVRRRIYDPSQFHETPAEATAAPPEPVAMRLEIETPDAKRPQMIERSPSFLPTQSWGASEDDELGPPSSVNVARALASLRSDELLRVEELLRHDVYDDEEMPTSSVIAPPMSLAPLSLAPVSRAPVSLAPLSLAHVQPPTVRLPSEIRLVELAEKLGVTADELVTALVTGGYFTTARTSTLPRETARLGAEMFGMRTEDMTAEEEAALAATRPRARKTSAKPASRKKPAAKKK